jgi:hypothetical protein
VTASSTHGKKVALMNPWKLRTGMNHRALENMSGIARTGQVGQGLDGMTP